jgi:hypothetical protein
MRRGNGGGACECECVLLSGESVGGYVSVNGTTSSMVEFCTTWA